MLAGSKQVNLANDKLILSGSRSYNEEGMSMLFLANICFELEKTVTLLYSIHHEQRLKNLEIKE